MICIFNEGGDLVLVNGREDGVDGAEVSRRDVVGARCAADSVVVELCTGIVAHIAGPDAAASGGNVIL